MFTTLLYLDPGSGSYLVQMIIAAILGGLFFFKNLWWRIKAFFTRDKNVSSYTRGENDTSTPKED
jgi:hypothetical protein